ncbi:MAG: ECF transporter S component [Firmicutes bacterium]|nr:ECF transporter S component [Candidatus Caballimonas caccae]
MQKKLKALFFSNLLVKATNTRKITYVALMTAFSIVSNMFFEIKLYDIQFSFTITVSCLIGILIGSLFGAVSCFLGDLIGYFINSYGQLYMPWVGLSSALFAFIAGMIFNGFKNKSKASVYIKLAVIVVLTFIICTVGVNSTGFYFYNKGMGFSEAVINYVNERFGVAVGYFGYVAYRLFFKGQIYNSLVNYFLLFIIVPLIVNNKRIRGSRDEREIKS